MVDRVTEQRNPLTMDIDRLDTNQILQLINKEDGKVAGAVNRVLPDIAVVVDKIYEGMEKGGRLIYVGAGTSGRLGVLDAVECVPTFNADPGEVRGILAGGRQAMFASQEDIEDNSGLGKQRINQEGLGPEDTVVGIAASGKTRFVMGALKQAKKQQSFTVALVCVRESPMEEIADRAIVPIVGPEVISGSTRMKAGTAQKFVLNMISTTVMIKLGKVYSNLMVDLDATNDKLRQRACSIFITLTGADKQLALKYLKQADYRVKTAIVMYERGCSFKEAEVMLEKNRGLLRAIIG